MYKQMQHIVCILLWSIFCFSNKIPESGCFVEKRFIYFSVLEPQEHSASIWLALVSPSDYITIWHHSQGTAMMSQEARET